MDCVALRVVTSDGRLRTALAAFQLERTDDYVALSIPVGAVLAGMWIQQGYASGPAETVVGALNAAAPVAGVAYGIAVLGEGSALTPTAGVLMLGFAAVAIWGVVLLSRIHPVSAGH